MSARGNAPEKEREHPMARLGWEKGEELIAAHRDREGGAETLRKIIGPPEGEWLRGQMRDFGCKTEDDRTRFLETYRLCVQASLPRVRMRQQLRMMRKTWGDWYEEGFNEGLVWILDGRGISDLLKFLTDKAFQEDVIEGRVESMARATSFRKEAYAEGFRRALQDVLNDVRATEAKTAIDRWAQHELT